MTLLDAPKYDERRERRKRTILVSVLSLLVVGFVGFWLAAGRPVDWPWKWQTYLVGRFRTAQFLKAVENNEMEKAYGIWEHDPKWQQHPNKYGYPYHRFIGDWGPGMIENTYGTIHSHKIVAARIHGNVLLMAILVNDRKSNALNMTYDPQDGTLDFAPEDVYIYLGK